MGYLEKYFFTSAIYEFLSILLLLLISSLISLWPLNVLRFGSRVFPGPCSIVAGLSGGCFHVRLQRPASEGWSGPQTSGQWRSAMVWSALCRFPRLLVLPVPETGV